MPRRRSPPCRPSSGRRPGRGLSPSGRSNDHRLLAYLHRRLVEHPHIALVVAAGHGLQRQAQLAVGGGELDVHRRGPGPARRPRPAGSALTWNVRDARIGGPAAHFRGIVAGKTLALAAPQRHAGGRPVLPLQLAEHGQTDPRGRRNTTSRGPRRCARLTNRALPAPHPPAPTSAVDGGDDARRIRPSAPHRRPGWSACRTWARRALVELRLRGLQGPLLRRSRSAALMKPWRAAGPGSACSRWQSAS